MSELVSRISERLDELERVARDATLPTNSGEWWVEHPTVRWGEEKPDRIASSGGDIATMEIETALASDHIAHWDPEAVLRLVVAARAILERHALKAPPHDYYRVCSTCMDQSDPYEPPSSVDWPCGTVLALAAGFGITEEASDV